MPIAASRERALREIQVRIAWASWGIPYGWSGDDPIAVFDCSGFACEDLKSVGLLARQERLTADGLWLRFGGWTVTEPQPGDLVFWFDGAGKAIHVEVLVDVIEPPATGPEDGLPKLFSMGASGGGPHVKTREDAIAANAFVKCRPVEPRGSHYRIANPYQHPTTAPA